MITIAFAAGFVAGVLFVAAGAFAIIWRESRPIEPPPRPAPRPQWVTFHTCGACGAMFPQGWWHTCNQVRERARPS